MLPATVRRTRATAQETLPAAGRALVAAGALVLAVAALSTGTARAAHVTDVADAMDERHPLEVDLDVGFTHERRSTRISRENLQLDPATQQKGIAFVDELQHTQTRDQLDFRLAVGLYHDLELHLVAPLVLRQLQEWGYAQVNGASVEPTSTLKNNHLDISGGSDPANIHPILPLPATASASGAIGQSLRAGFGDPTIGIAWGPINEEREAQLRPELYPPGRPVSTWVIGLDYTLPLPGGDLDDPSKFGVNTADATANQVSHPLGRKTHLFSPWTAFSKRYRVLNPYFVLRASLPVVSRGASAGDGAYDNCWHPETLSDVAPQNCALAAWKGATGYQPPYTGAFTVGTELVVGEDVAAQQKVAFDLKSELTWFSPGRTYTPVSDALGKLTYEEEHLQLVATLGFYGRAARWLHFRVSGMLGFDTPHFLTSESVGKDLNNDGTVAISAGGSPKSQEQSPVYDFRLDQVGRRLRAEAVLIWGVSGFVSLNF